MIKLTNHTTSADIALFNALLDSDPLQYTPYEFTAAGEVEAFADKNSIILFYLYALLPFLLSAKFSVKYNVPMLKAFLTRDKNTEMLADFVGVCKLAKCTKLTTVEKALNSSKLPFKLETFEIFSEFLVTARPKLKTILSREAITVFNKLYFVYSMEEYDEEAVDKVITVAFKIPKSHLKLKMIIQSIDVESNKVEDSFIENKNYLQQVTTKYFKKKNPNQEDMSALREKSPDKYKEFRALTTKVNKLSKVVLSREWDKQGLDIVSIPEVEKLCKQLNIECSVPKGFIGLVGLAPTEGTQFCYYTKYGKELDVLIGKSVTMNPKYTKDDDVYYCSCVPMVSTTGKAALVYSKEYRSKSSQALHACAYEIAQVIDDVRTTLVTDMTPIVKGDFTTKALCASVVYIIDQTAGRIGNKTSEEKAKTFGIHNLLKKHISFSEVKDRVVISYIGKDGVHQKHILDDKKAVKLLKALCDGKKPSQYVFSGDGVKCVSDTTVGKYLKTTGFPGSAHKFRKYHANSIFAEVTANASSSTYEKVFKKAAEAVAAKLGNTPTISIGAYISPTLMKAYFQKFNATPPKVVQKAIDRIEYSTASMDESD